MENMVIKNIFWPDRPTFVTGATGRVGSWLIQRLVDTSVDVVCFVRDWVPQSESIRKGVIETGKVVRGDVRNAKTLVKPELGGEAFNFSKKIPQQYLSAEKVHCQLSWQPLFTLEEGLACTIELFRNFFRAML
jgi:nucleoside-diphosphate-sugar epimerase